MYGINSPKTFNFSAFRYVAIQKKVIRNSLNNTVTGTNVLMSYCIQHYCPDLSRFNISPVVQFIGKIGRFYLV